ncbi:MAG: hypothetical protein FE040_01895 [Thermoplasmata archaeon]|nr:MAG: hypothetical protein FE040_01895 [Thermoplasmata archaeon]RLF45466.1 MAG: hypothetical protein DRN17_02485 [Thermoplasmata archaeon]RLF47337.1 MAG: hypothetical protein DRN10_03970 [Thermoplasmata archaeon]
MDAPFIVMQLNKGMLSFLSGLGFTGLGFYIWFFTLYYFDWKIGWIFVFSVATAVLGAVVIWCIFVAFSLIDTEIRLSSTAGGFIGGILSMAAIILMILSFRIGDYKWYEVIHPIVSFFMAAGCTTLLIYPLEEKESNKW